AAGAGPAAEEAADHALRQGRHGRAGALRGAAGRADRAGGPERPADDPPLALGPRPAERAARDGPARSRRRLRAPTDRVRARGANSGGSFVDFALNPARAARYNLMAMLHHRPNPADAFLSRRDLLRRCGMGMGGLTLATLLGETGMLAPSGAARAADLLAGPA